jgi:hypothetical protein
MAFAKRLQERAAFRTLSDRELEAELTVAARRRVDPAVRFDTLLAEKRRRHFAHVFEPPSGAVLSER